MNRRARDCGREMMYIHSSRSDGGNEERGSRAGGGGRGGGGGGGAGGTGGGRRRAIVGGQTLSVIYAEPLLRDCRISNYNLA